MSCISNAAHGVWFRRTLTQIIAILTLLYFSVSNIKSSLESQNFGVPLRTEKKQQQPQHYLLQNVTGVLENASAVTKG
jgi:hypothetical protein